jgi:enamine deaminase RidA (YjgF/YER057c/UK114 family)
MPNFPNSGDLPRSSVFSTAEGCEEIFFSLLSPKVVRFSEALSELENSYAAALNRLGLSDETAVFSRIFISDIVNQKPALFQSPLFNRLRTSCALSVIEQKPLFGGPVALLSYHLRDPDKTVTKRLLNSGSSDWHNDLLVKGSNYSLLWTANHTGGDTFDAYAQTKTIFDSLNAIIEGQGMNLLENGIRTWVYVRDVDNHYRDMVRARREYFAAHDLTEKTRYLASTGILGRTFSPEKIVSVDSLSIGGLAAGQIVRMEALSHLSPTILYGVTFERGLRVRFGDRSHLHISGTASINVKGEVLYPGDVEAQTRRTIENVRALLEAQAAALDDLAYVIVYVRNAHDFELVERVLCEELSEKVPMIFAEAAVCRSAWLMELEGIAIVPDKNGFPPFL